MNEEKKPAEDHLKKRYTIEEYLQMERASDQQHEYYQGEITPYPNHEVKEAAVDYLKQKYTIEEYLQMERASDQKHEYYKGEIFAMAGASHHHNIIFSNVFGRTFISLQNSSCRPYGSDMRMHIPENTLFTYPDIAIYCGDLDTFGEEQENALHPVVIIEILSNSTRNYDLGKKFQLYRDITTLKEYVLIDSERIGVQVFRINGNGRWEPEEYKTLQEVVTIPTVGVSLSMQDIYQGVKL